MKRSVAILGPTPSFVRWAIRSPCSLRQLDVENLPDATFRQLRGVRELSVARKEEREHAGICFHATETENVDSALGFFSEEVSDFFGGIENIESCCKNCHANAVSSAHDDDKIWAGCYGWFKSQFSDTEDINTFDYIRAFENVAANWYKVWQTNTWADDRLETLNKIFSQIEKPATDPALAELTTAISVCLQNDLALETELVPGGNSDGFHWTINSHCPACKYELPESQLSCDGCGRQGTPNRAVKRKVLGLRPYVKLFRLLGANKTEQLLAEYVEGASP